MLQAINNPTTDEMCEELENMRTHLGLFLKYVSGDPQTVNMRNYLTKSPPPLYEYYYDKEAYIVNDQMMGFRPNAQGSNQEN